MITAYTYAESYTQQPTRAYYNDETLSSFILASNTAGGSDSLTNTVTSVAAPARASQEIDAILSGDIHRSGKNFLIWPDEYFIGPSVLRSPLPTWFTYMADSVTASKEPVNDNTLYQLYANYEFLRSRAEQKSGAVVTIFNPYVAAGHPGVVFDNTSTGNHVFAYFSTVSHNLSPLGMSTQIGYNYAQTFQEFFSQFALDLAGQNNLSVSTSIQTQITELQKQLNNFQGQLNKAIAAGNSDDIASLTQNVASTQNAISTLQSLYTTPLDFCPASPIPIVRSQFQNTTNASDYYNQLFYQSQPATSQSSAFNWRNVIGLANLEDPTDPSPIKFTVSPPPATVPGQPVQSATVTSNIPTGLTLGTPEYVLLPPYNKLAQNTQSAIQACSRPITTLEQYIDFAGDHGVRVNPQNVNAEHGNYGGVYYEQILEFVPGPGVAPVEQPPGSGNIGQPVVAELYQDWAAILKLYRQKVLYGLQPYQA